MSSKRKFKQLIQNSESDEDQISENDSAQDDNDSMQDEGDEADDNEDEYQKQSSIILKKNNQPQQQIRVLGLNTNKRLKKDINESGIRLQNQMKNIQKKLSNIIDALIIGTSEMRIAMPNVSDLDNPEQKKSKIQIVNQFTDPLDFTQQKMQNFDLNNSFVQTNIRIYIEYLKMLYLDIVKLKSTGQLIVSDRNPYTKQFMYLEDLYSYLQELVTSQANLNVLVSRVQINKKLSENQATMFRLILDEIVRLKYDHPIFQAIQNLILYNVLINPNYVGRNLPLAVAKIYPNAPHYLYNSIKVLQIKLTDIISKFIQPQFSQYYNTLTQQQKQEFQQNEVQRLTHTLQFLGLYFKQGMQNPYTSGLSPNQYMKIIQIFATIVDFYTFWSQQIQKFKQNNQQNLIENATYQDLQKTERTIQLKGQFYRNQIDKTFNIDGFFGDVNNYGYQQAPNVFVNSYKAQVDNQGLNRNQFLTNLNAFNQ